MNQLDMFRKFKFIVPILIVFSIITSFQLKTNTDPKDKVLITILKYVLTQWHYEPNDINNQFSESVYSEFLDRIDPSKRYFLQSDIDEFSRFKFSIDDQLKKENLDFFYLVHDRLKERMKTSRSYYKEILQSKFDLNKNEVLDVDYKNSDYAKSENELITIWNKQLKFNTFSRLYDRLNDEEAKQKDDPNYQPKSLEVLERESRKVTEENMDDYFGRIDELELSDWFNTYVNCISEEFDLHTTYLDASYKKRFDIQMAGKLEGIGARLVKEKDYTKVSELISGGPAWKKGELEVGDLILKVAEGDAEPIEIVGMRLDDAIEYIKGKKGTEVRLTIKKIDGLIKVISITRDVVEIEETFVKSSVIEKDGRTFGVINLPKFYIDFGEKSYRNSATDMAKEIELLKKENIEGLVIDLRNNGGGSLETAIDISGLFIDQGPVVQVKYRGKDALVRKDKNQKIQWDGPLVVLVNEFSASASEIFAAAMQDYKRAVIIGGKQTYGKGTVQTILDLNQFHSLKEDLGALKITIQKFYRINGGSTQLEGVHSDIMLPSRYSYMDFGERNQENALKFDKVPQANYAQWNNYDNFAQVVQNSKNRISNNSYFKLIDNNAKWLKETQDDTSIDLNFEAYKNDLDSHKEESMKYSALKDFKSDYTYNSPLYELELLKTDEDKAAKRLAWHNNLKKDIYVEEAINVLSELRIKPTYHLVKN